MSFDNISRELIERAFNEYDTLGRDVFLKKYDYMPSRVYFVEKDGKRYDLKAIMGAARSITEPSAAPLRYDEFNNNFQEIKGKMQEMGYNIIKRSEEESTIRDLFSDILENYPKAKENYDAYWPNVREAIIQLSNKITASKPFLKRSNLKVDYTGKMRRLANVPWIAIMDKRETTSVQRGVYCVYIFKANMKGFYLTLNQGVGLGAKKAPNKKMINEVHEKAIKIRDRSLELKIKGFSLDDDIKLNDPGKSGAMYEKSTIAYKYYDATSIPDDEEILNDLESVLQSYNKYIENTLGLEEKTTESENEIGTSEVPTVKSEINPKYTREDFLHETGSSEAELDLWLKQIERKKQIIFQGPPGTGKTFIATKLARLIVSEKDGYLKTVQFHPAFSYEDFIQGYTLDSKNGPSFKLKQGIFLNFCEIAAKRRDRSVMIIDEINRANIARVFGELMYLLEYREEIIPLSAGGTFGIPESVVLIGTMNTADRSIAVVDHALRRRFGVFRLKPRYDLLKKHLEANNLPSEELVNVLEDINRSIGDINYNIGTSFFLKDIKKLREELPLIWKTEIEPFLEEFFYDQPPKANAFKWDKLVQDRLRVWGTNSL